MTYTLFLTRPRILHTTRVYALICMD